MNQPHSKKPLPRKVWPVSIKVVTSGCHVKLDLVELIQVVDDVRREMGLEEGTPSVIPVTAKANWTKTETPNGAVRVSERGEENDKAQT